MSQSALAWAVAQPLRGPAKPVLLVLAWHANAEGVCWPSLARLAEEAGVCERAARMALRRLEMAGAVERQERPLQTPTYRVLLSPIAGAMPSEQPRLALFSAIRGTLDRSPRQEAACG